VKTNAQGKEVAWSRNLSVALAMFDYAAKMFPDEVIHLRQRTRVIRQHRPGIAS